MKFVGHLRPTVHIRVKYFKPQMENTPQEQAGIYSELCNLCCYKEMTTATHVTDCY